MFAEVLLAILFFVYPLGQLERIPLGSPEIGFYCHDIIIGLLLFYWLGRKIIKKEKIKLHKFGQYILFFGSIAFFSYLINIPKRTGSEIFIAGLYLIRWLAYSSLYFVLQDLKIRQLFNCSIVQLLIVVGSVAAGFGILQYIFYPDIRPLTAFEWDPHYYRVVGTYLEPGFAGLIFILTMVLIVEKCWAKNLKTQFTIYYLLFTIIYIAFALTYSRSAYLAYLLAMSIIAWVKKSWKFLLFTLLIFALTLYILPHPSGEGVKLERQYTFWSRFASWQNGLKIWSDYPIFGVGFNFYRYAARDYGFLGKNWISSHAGAGVDNSFLFVLSTTGLVGLSLYFWLLGTILVASYKNIKKSANLMIFISFAICGIHANFNNTLFYPWIMIWLWVLLGAYGA